MKNRKLFFESNRIFEFYTSETNRKKESIKHWRNRLKKKLFVTSFNTVSHIIFKYETSMKTTIMSAALLLGKFELIKILLYSFFKALIPVVTSLLCFECESGGNCNDPFTSTSTSLASGVTTAQNCGACVVSQMTLDIIGETFINFLMF